MKNRNLFFRIERYGAEFHPYKLGRKYDDWWDTSDLHIWAPIWTRESNLRRSALGKVLFRRELLIAKTSIDNQIKPATMRP